VQYLRTADDRFQQLPGYDFSPRYLTVDDTEGGLLRLHYLDEGPRQGSTILLLHGEPSWSYLYRKMVPIFADAGHRVIAPDLIGFGRSDKPALRTDHTYQRHVDWIRSAIRQLRLRDITLVCQDWGGLIGLRILGENPEWFAKVVAANTMLPTGDHPPGEAFLKWRAHSQSTPVFSAGKIIRNATATTLSPEVVAAYDAPFPDERYQAGARQFPLLVPISPEDPATPANREAWKSLRNFEKPFLTAFSDKDPITAAAAPILQKLIPGTRGQPHTIVENAGHFLQEDQGEALAQVVLRLCERTPDK
jgi:haloalkane dehalogenase